MELHKHTYYILSCQLRTMPNLIEEKEWILSETKFLRFQFCTHFIERKTLGYIRINVSRMSLNNTKEILS